MTSADFQPKMVTALREAKKKTVLTGAGVSAESGIPTFRDALTGLWQHFDAERLATPEAFQRDPALVWGWYEWRRMKVLAAQPNAVHLAISALADRVSHLSLFTQNVDDLHERAGSTAVQHLHGSLLHPRCFECGNPFTLPDGIPEEPHAGRRLSPPKCQACGGLVRPGVVWFNEALPAHILSSAMESARSCDLLIVLGTSGVVYPVAHLPEVARSSGRKIIQINSAPSELDSICTWNVRGRAGQLFPTLLSRAF